MQDLTGKKILILGAMDGMGYAARVAKQAGIHTTVIDYHPSSPAKEFADKSYDVSTADLEAIKEIARRDGISGVFTGCSDHNLRMATELSRMLSFPFYANEEQILYTQDKNRFKKLCQRHGIPVPVSFDPESEETITFPVIVKPSDSYAAKGIRVCRNREELSEAVRTASEYSSTGEVVVESYLSGDEVMIHYVMIHGEFRLTAVMNRYIAHEFSEGGSSIAPIIITTDCPYREQVLRYEEALGEMMRSIGLEHAIGFFQGKSDGKGIYLYEMALRLGGNVPEIFNASCGQPDLILEFMRFSLTGEFDPDCTKHLSAVFDSYCCNVTLFLKEDGRVASIRTPEDLSEWPEIRDLQRHCGIGDINPKEKIGTYQDIAFRIVFVAKDKKRVADILEELKGRLGVLDEKGEDLIDWDMTINRLQRIP